MTWIARGQKPDRNIKASAGGFLEGLIRGVANRDENPFVRAGVTALASAFANNPHRIADRLRAKRSMDTLIDKGFKAKQMAPPPKGPEHRNMQSPVAESAAFSTTLGRIAAAKASSGSNSVLVFMPTSLWSGMSSLEHAHLQDAEGISLRLLDHINALVVVPLPSV
jgi:hypothetical protein